MARETIKMTTAVTQLHHSPSTAFHQGPSILPQATMSVPLPLVTLAPAQSPPSPACPTHSCYTITPAQSPLTTVTLDLAQSLPPAACLTSFRYPSSCSVTDIVHSSRPQSESLFLGAWLSLHKPPLPTLS